MRPLYRLLNWLLGKLGIEMRQDWQDDPENK
jgi:hypothetical protein